MRREGDESVAAVIPDSPSMSLELPRYGVDVQDSVPRSLVEVVLMDCFGFGSLGSCKRRRISEMKWNVDCLYKRSRRILSTKAMMEIVESEEGEGESLCRVVAMAVVLTCCTPRFGDTQADGTKTSPWQLRQERQTCASTRINHQHTSRVSNICILGSF